MSNYQHLLTKAFNTPLAVDASYARTFFSALANRMGGVDKLIDLDGNAIDANAMQVEASSYNKGRATSRSYQVIDGIAVVPVDGSLVHKLGALHPYSGMTGYDGIHRKLTEAMSDDSVRGVMLDIDSPGGMVNGCFDLADIIARYRDIKPIWSLGYDMHTSAAQLIASSCSHRLVTQTAITGSVGVIMAHTNIEKMMEQKGAEITLITAGKHKAEGNPYEALPDDVKDKWTKQLESLRLSFATKVADYSGKEVKDILATEAACFEGQAAVEVGFANEVVNGSDALAVMSEHLNAQSTTTVDMGASMTKATQDPKKGATASPEENPTPEANTPEPQTTEQTTDASAVDAERDRVMGILGLPEAKGREALANKLAGTAGMSVEAAKDLLSAAPEAVSQRDDAALAALGQQHGASLSSNVGSDVDNDDATAVALLVGNSKK